MKLAGPFALNRRQTTLAARLIPVRASTEGSRQAEVGAGVATMWRETGRTGCSGVPLFHAT